MRMGELIKVPGILIFFDASEGVPATLQNAICFLFVPTVIETMSSL